MPKTLIGHSPAFCRRDTTAPGETPSAPVRGLKMVRFAGFRRLHPIVPDRTAFGAAVKGETDGDYAENQCQSPEHGPPTPHTPIIGPQGGHFQAVRDTAKLAYTWGPSPPNTRPQRTGTGTNAHAGP